MVWNIFGKKKPHEEFDALHDVKLKNLSEGWMVDYDMQTWEVKAHHKYDWGDGYMTDEWELESSTGTIYLEYDPEDGGEFAVSRKIPIGKIEGNIKAQLMKEEEDAPGQIVFEGKTYYLDEDGGGLFLENGTGPEQELIYWDYVDDSQKNFVTIEQWSDTEFEASAGSVVEEYQFENILPCG